MTQAWTTSNTPHYTSLLVGHQLAFVLHNLLPLCIWDQRASRDLHSLPGPSPVLPRGHQGPNAPAAHSPSSEYSGPLPSSSTGGRHPTVSPDTAGWQQRGGRCFHCKPENQDAKWRTHREGGNSTRERSRAACRWEGRADAGRAAEAFKNYLCIHKRQATGQLQKEANELQVRLFCRQMQGCAATFTILGKARRGRMKIQMPGLRQHTLRPLKCPKQHSRLLQMLPSPQSLLEAPVQWNFDLSTWFLSHSTHTQSSH